MVQPPMRHNGDNFGQAPNHLQPADADRALLEAGFDKEAFGRAFLEGAYTAARRFSSQLTADDLVQDTFVIVWQTFLTGREVNNPAGAAFKKATWEALKKLEREPTRKFPHILVEDAWQLCDERDDIERRVIAKDGLAKIIWGTLTTDYQREVYVRNVLEGATSTEIAEDMGLHPEAVKTQCRRSKSAIDRAIQEIGRIG